MKLRITLFLVLGMYNKSFCQRLYSDIQNSAVTKKEVIVVKTRGFIQSHIDNRAAGVTVLRTNFYNDKAEILQRNSFSLTKSRYLGFVSNNESSHFIFYDNFNKKMYIPSYNELGNLITNKTSRLKSRIKDASIPFYDSTAFYIVEKNGKKIIITKLNYQYDTLWSTRVRVAEATTWTANKSDDVFYLLINSFTKSTLFISINDPSGESLVDMDLGEEKIKRVVSASLVDNEEKKIILSGDETRGKNKFNMTHGKFVFELDMNGTFLNKSFFNNEKIFYVKNNPGLDEDKQKSFLAITDMIKLNSDYLLIGESVFRSDFQGEEILTGLISAVLIATLTPGIGYAAISGALRLTSKNFGIIYPEPSGESLLLKKIDKGPIEKTFPQGINQPSHLNEMYDYKYSLDIPGGKQLIFFHSLHKDKITIGSVKITESEPLKVVKYEYFTTNERGSNFKIYPLNKESLLLEVINMSHAGYVVIPYAQFR